eukprot:TRINITY_DN1274_c2_g1_i1.p1 TRINITY_DN1274_c2_g1~~TRINITY_DN1274_c2_g1_i1.p1  ORF type:complete len:122 (-),score=12.16 TRINITY_DN1274_c2_g1_i1:150-515(-)
MAFTSIPLSQSSLVLDKTSMFKVKTRFKSDNKLYQHECKPLPLIWAHLPEYSEKNTIHIDDLSRNFVMNSQSGLKIRAFNNSDPKSAKDRELYKLAKYLTSIASLNDFTVLDHGKWKKYKP